MLHVLISCSLYSHSLNMKTRKLGIFRKSPRPSLLIKRAALGNLKTSFHCTHWHRFFPLKKEFFRIPPSPFSQRESFSKTYPSFLTVKEGVFSTSPSLLQGELHLSHQASLPSGTRGCNRPPVLRTATL